MKISFNRIPLTNGIFSIKRIVDKRMSLITAFTEPQYYPVTITWFITILNTWQIVITKELHVSKEVPTFPMPEADEVIPYSGPQGFKIKHYVRTTVTR